MAEYRDGPIEENTTARGLLVDHSHMGCQHVTPGTHGSRNKLKCFGAA